jgi:hypothetical protein
MLAALVAATCSAVPPTLRPAAYLQFPGATDSNSPGHWDGPTFYLFNSTGHPYRSYGSDIFELATRSGGDLQQHQDGGRWMEATWRPPTARSTVGIITEPLGPVRQRADGAESAANHR